MSVFHNIKIVVSGIENFTGFCDITGERIFIGSRVQFSDCSGAKWIGTVDFEDGLVTVGILDVDTVCNPDKWDKTYDWTKSRWWSVTVGYGEYGTWNCNRRSIIDIAGNFKTFDEYNTAQNKYTERYGQYSSIEIFRPLPCLII